MSDNIRSSGVAVPGIALPAALALVSAAALVVEIVAGRLLAPYVGMSLYTWTAIIAVVLAGLSIGHWIGGVLDPGDRPRTFFRMALAMFLAAISTALIPLLVRAFSGPLLAGGLPPLLAIVTLVTVLFLLPSLFAGTLSPMLTRLVLDSAPPERRSRMLGRMFAAGALGSIAGTLIAGFVLIAWVGTLGTLLGVAAVEALLAGAFLVAARPGRAAVAASATVGVGAVAILLVASTRSDAFDSPCTVESSYFCIRVIDYEVQSERPSRLMVLDHMGHGINDRDEPRWLHSSYTALSDRLVRLRDITDTAFSAFFVGGGAYTVPRAWLHAFPEADLTVAELDPAVTAIARSDFWLPESPRLHTVHGDARAILERKMAHRRFHVVFGDAFHDISVPAHLTTREFAETVRSRLHLSGVYLVHVLDLATEPRFLLSKVRTLMEVFPSVEVWVDDAQWRSGGRISYLVLAASSPTPAAALRGQSPDDEAEGRAWTRLPAQALHRAAMASTVTVLVDDHAPVDRLMYHVLEKDL